MATHFRPSPGKKSEAKRNVGATARNAPALESASNEDRFAKLRERNLARHRERAARGPVDFTYDAWFASYGTEFPQEMATPNLGAQERAVIGGTDERVQVHDTTEYPWRAVCQLDIKGAEYGWVGTAWFLTARLLITAGHCVYLHDDGGWASEIVVSPGRNGADKPYGSVTAKKFRCVQAWKENQNSPYDLGGILLPADHPFGDLGFFGCDAFDDQTLMETELTVGGYPGQDPDTPQFNKPKNTLWYDKGNCFDVASTNLKYTMDTQGGQSGGVVYFPGDNGPTAVGVHTAGSTQSNFAVRITPQVLALFKQWAKEAGEETTG